MGIHKLSARRVATAGPGKHGDGGGLWLVVRKDGRKTWVFRYMRFGRAREMGLGSLRDVSLAEAREAAACCRKLLRDGKDPIEERRKERARTDGLTFREAADAFLKAHRDGWKNPKHRQQWENTLAQYAFPVLGDLPVNAIETAHVLRVLEPIWKEKPETASRLRGRLERILDWATVRGYRTGDNPARWRGHLQALLPAKTKVRAVRHHAALPWRDLPGFMAALREREGVAARALEFLILTAARSGEVRGARWDEIDRQARIWTVPAERMKARRPHRVPLSDRALAILEAMRPLADDAATGLVFPGLKRGRPLSDVSLAKVLKRMGRDDLTVHGFRSTFRDWAAEATAYPREVAEQALAHAISDKVEAAYRRGDLFEKRRRLMEDWASYCERPPGEGEVVAIRAESV